jgi:hypothetical protein
MTDLRRVNAATIGAEATLKTWGRQHALVAEQDAAGGITRIRGIFFGNPNRPSAGRCGATIRRRGYFRGHCAGARGLSVMAR